MPVTFSAVAEISEEQFRKISMLVKSACGINLHLGKKELVKARLNKRLRELGFKNFGQYIDYLHKDTSHEEFIFMLDAISTNLTQFFREPLHFEYLAEKILPKLMMPQSKNGKKIRIWSAGCSTGEEPFSIAILMNEKIANLETWNARILATDLSTRVLKRAKEGIYVVEELKGVSPFIRTKYFTCMEYQSQKKYKLHENVTRLVHFARLNLIDHWPMKGRFDVIFCRNVMIYFEKQTQQELINRFHDILTPGGTLFIGHSESLAGVKHNFKYIQPTVYEKP